MMCLKRYIAVIAIYVASFLAEFAEGQDSASCIDGSGDAFDEVSALQVHATLRSGSDRDMDLLQMLNEESKYPAVLARSGGDVAANEEMQNTLMEVEREEAQAEAAKRAASGAGNPVAGLKQTASRSAPDTMVLAGEGFKVGGHSSFNPEQARIEKLAALIQDEKSRVDAATRKIQRIGAVNQVPTSVNKPVRQNVSVETDLLNTGEHAKAVAVNAYENFGDGWCRPTCDSRYASSGLKVSADGSKGMDLSSDGTEEQCRTNGFYKDGSSDSECKSTCDELGTDCVGYAVSNNNYTSFPNRCFVYVLEQVSMVRSRSGWTDFAREYYDIASSDGGAFTLSCYGMTPCGVYCYRNLAAATTTTTTIVEQQALLMCSNSSDEDNGKTAVRQADGRLLLKDDLDTDDVEWFDVHRFDDNTLALKGIKTDGTSLGTDSSLGADVRFIEGSVNGKTYLTTNAGRKYVVVNSISVKEPVVLSIDSEFRSTDFNCEVEFRTNVWRVDKATLMSLECFPILNALGITRMYMGCYLTGIVQGLTTCLSMGIVGHAWALADFVILGKNSLNKDKYIDKFGMHCNFEEGTSIDSARDITWIACSTWTLYYCFLFAGYYKFYMRYY
jgi:hypothetical protein